MHATQDNIVPNFQHAVYTPFGKLVPAYFCHVFKDNGVQKIFRKPLQKFEKNGLFYLFKQCVCFTNAKFITNWNTSRYI